MDIGMMHAASFLASSVKRRFGPLMRNVLILGMCLACSALPAHADDISPEFRQLLRDIATDLELRAQTVRKGEPICPLLALAHGTDGLKKKAATDGIRTVVVEPLNNGIRFAATSLGARPIVVAAYDVTRCALDHDTPEGFAQCIVDAAFAYVTGLAGNIVGGDTGLGQALTALAIEELRALAVQQFQATEGSVAQYQSKKEKWRPTYEGIGCEVHIMATWDRRAQPGAQGGHIKLVIEPQCDCDESTDTQLHYRFALGARERIKTGMVGELEIPVQYTPAGPGDSSPGWEVPPLGNIPLAGTCCGSQSVDRCILDVKGVPTVVRLSEPTTVVGGGTTEGDDSQDGDQPGSSQPKSPELDPVTGRCPPCERDAAALADAQVARAETLAMLDNRRLALRRLEGERHVTLSEIRKIEARLRAAASDDAITTDPTTGVTTRRRDLGNGMVRVTTTYPNGTQTVRERPSQTGEKLLPRLKEARAALRKLDEQMDRVRGQIEELERELADIEATIARLRRAIEECIVLHCSKKISRLEFMSPSGADSPASAIDGFALGVDGEFMNRPMGTATSSLMPPDGQHGTETMADLDFDGVLDTIQVDAANRALNVNFGDGSGAYSETVQIGLDATPHRVTAGDLNFDGLTDLVAASETGGQLTTILNGGNRAFQLGDKVMLERTPGDLLLEDVSGDGIPDIVISDPSSEEGVTLEGFGDGIFAPPVLPDPNSTLEHGTWPVRPVDGMSSIQF